MKRFAFLAAVFVALSSGVRAQVARAPTTVPFWDDTLSESPIYPIGDAIPVYRAVLDLIYLDGNKRPSVIVMLDSAVGHMGGPCPFDKCPAGSGLWKHKSKMDTSTVMAYARLTRKRPGIRPFGYPIPIVFYSQDDLNRMEADGRELLASHPMPPDLPKRGWGFPLELERKYPGAWGSISLSKVGFNQRHTEALVQAHELCGDDCRVHETLFLRQTKGRWRVVERIAAEIDPGSTPYGRYLGPAVTGTSGSEVLIVDRPGVPYEATARADVYRIVLDSLYSVNGERPKRVVLTNWFWTPGDIPAHTSVIDSALVKKFSVLGAIRAPLDVISKYRVPVSRLPLDSVPALRERGKALDVDQTGFPFWVAFADKYRGAWGMLGLSRIAFNADRSQALVYTYHACGDGCVAGDIWFLTRSGKQWQIAERIKRDYRPTVDIEPLRYVGADVNPAAYRPRRAQGVVTNAETGAPIPGFTVRIRRMLNSGLNIDDPSPRTDSLGVFTISRLPLNATMTLMFDCPNGSPDGRMFVPLYVTPGLDTTINIPFSMAVCNFVPPAPAPDSSSRVKGVSSIPQGPSFSQRMTWMYLTAVAKPIARTRMRTWRNLIPLNEKYPPADVVVRAMTESGASPFMIATSALPTPRWLGSVTMPPMVLGVVDGGGPSGSFVVSESSNSCSPFGRTDGST